MKSKGGRGKKAPYDTTHVRVPLPVKAEVDAVVERFRNGGRTQQELVNKYDLDRAIQLANDALKQKKSARATMSRFLSEMYGQDIIL